MDKLRGRTTWAVLLLVLGGLSLAACGGSTSKKPVDVQVTLNEFSIQSSLETFDVGVPYHFVVSNQGSVAHDFMIGAPTQGTVSEDDAEASALITIESEDLQPGATKTLDYTFTQAAPAGTLEFACHVPGHYEAGMKLPITVK